MTQLFKQTSRFDANPEQLVKVLTNPEFVVEDQKMDPAVINAEYNLISQTDDTLKFEILMLEYEKGIRGINRMKREKSRMILEWALKMKTCRWEYVNESQKKLKCEGSYEIIPLNGGGQVSFEISLEFKTPIVGKTMERFIMREIVKGIPRWEQLITRYISQA